VSIETSDLDSWDEDGETWRRLRALCLRLRAGRGLLVPTRRRVYLTDEDARPMADYLMVSIDLSDWRFE
jgi:hypothetical protein